MPAVADRNHICQQVVEEETWCFAYAFAMMSAEESARGFRNANTNGNPGEHQVWELLANQTL
jgi:hypothetical protein